jgi:PAS domain S-box-containing protein
MQILYGIMAIIVSRGMIFAQREIKGMGVDSRERDNLIKLAIDEMIEGIQIIDSNWRYLYVNQAAAAHGKTTTKALMGKTMMECYPGIEKTGMFEELQQVLKTGQPRRIENEFEYEDQEKSWFELFIEPYSDGILIRSIEISDRKRLEEQLLQSQKMEAIGALAGGIAHDFNNKLAIMMIYCEMASNLLKDKESSANNYVLKTLEAVKQSTRLTRQLLAFSRKQVLNPQVMNLNDFLSNMRESLEKLMGETILLDFELAQDLGQVRLDPAQMDQVVLNLCLNAKDAMPDGGRLLVETLNIDLDEAYVGMHPDVIPGEYVMLAFSDTGKGMEREVLNKIFDPFFTTKGIGKGTGLGLSMVHGIVKQSKGHVWAYSELGLGAVFKIYIPLVKEKVEGKTRRSQHPISYRGNETILLVEDDGLLREAYEVALKGAGYNVLSASEPIMAIKIFTENEANIHLVLTDLIMPKMNGRALAEKLRKIRPDLKVIYMSGYTENSIVHQGVLDTESILIQKPISIATMLETIRKVLEGLLKKGVL